MRCFAGIDLGTTNIKAAVYDGDMRLLRQASRAVVYDRSAGRVEFDAEAYFDALIALLREALAGDDLACLALTGQAESLVLLGGDNRPLMNAISWMDERSTAECAALAKDFDSALCQSVTGQMAVLPTWPATKVLWLKRNRPEVHANIAKALLLKDYIAYRLTGEMRADASIATFSFWFDIYQKRYWGDMLRAIGLREAQLAPLSEPCADAGALLPDVARALGTSSDARVNLGTLDHFAGMIGTGNTAPGKLTLATGTTMVLAAMSEEPAPRDSGIAMHYGFLPDTHVMLPVVESGGASLEWFRQTCMPGADYGEINRGVAARGQPERPLIFLPNIVGTNAPDFDPNATGVFWGLRQEHDAYDMARAVMEGVACALRQNLGALSRAGTDVRGIIATGGGAKSPVWCQIYADIAGVPLSVPAETDATCLGAGIIAAVSAGRWSSYADAAEALVQMEAVYTPSNREAAEAQYARYLRLREALKDRV